MLRLGSTGPQVAELQKRLKALGYYPGAIDGIFGPITERAVKMFQAAAGILVDGIVGPQTMAALAAAEAKRRNEYPVLKYGSTDQYVAMLQRKLKEHGFDPGPVDGIFGVQTLSAVQRFQRAKGLAADGIVGPQTWAALNSAHAGGEKPHPLLAKKVCIDPGHGGFDPGAISGNVREKDITLAIAVTLKEILEARGMKIIMTREGDYAPGQATDVNSDLRNRVAIANNSGADIFVSIHTNSAENENAFGCECYAYQQRGAAWRLAAAVQKNIVDRTGMFDRGVKTARFFVLRETVMPAVLVEAGFISNPGDRQKLCDTEFRRKIAEGCAAGIEEYLG